MKPAYKRWLYCVLCVTLLGISAGQTVAANDAAILDAVKQGRQEGVPDSVLDHVLSLGFRYNLDAQTVVRFLDLAKQAKAADLPLDPIVGKIDEGLAKHIQPGAINRAVRGEIERYRFVQELAHKAMQRHDMDAAFLRGEDLAKMVKAMSMGLQIQQLQTFFEEAPGASMAAYAHALELMAAMTQSGLSPEISKDIALTGLEKGYFTESAWGLAFTVHAAKMAGLTNARISEAALAVVRGRQSLAAVQKSLNIDPKSFNQDSRRGPSAGGRSMGGGSQAGDASGGPGIGGGGHGGGSGGGSGGGPH